MKKTATLLIALAALFSITLAGCEKDSQDTETNAADTTANSGGNQGGSQGGNSQDIRIQDNGNTMTADFTIQDDIMGTINFTIHLTFGADSRCTQAIAKATFSSEAMAQMAYNEMLKDPDYNSQNCQLDGRTITIDITSECQGKTKEEIKTLLQLLKSQIENGEQDLDDLRPVITENPNEIIATYTLTQPFAITTEYKFELQNGQCTRATCTLAFQSPQIAQLMYSQIAEQYGDKIRINSNIITIDMTDDFAGQTREQILEAITTLSGGLDLGDDDDTDDNWGDNQPVITETPTQITLTTTATDPVDIITKYDFLMREGICVQATITYTLKTEQTAQIMYESIAAEAAREGIPVTINGSVITMDISDKYAGMTRDEIMQIIDILAGQNSEGEDK